MLPGESRIILYRTDPSAQRLIKSGWDLDGLQLVICPTCASVIHAARVPYIFLHRASDTRTTPAAPAPPLCVRAGGLFVI